MMLAGGGAFAYVVMVYKYHNGVFSQTLTENIDKIDSAKYFVTPKIGQKKNT